MMTMRHLQTLSTCLLLAISSAALAQFVAPSISLSSTTLAPGETLRFDARQLVPNGSYSLRLDGPSGLRVGSTLTSDPNGSIRFETQLDAPGAWTLRFEGDDVDILLGLEVVAGVTAPGPAPSRQVPTPPATDGEAVTDPVPEESPADGGIDAETQPPAPDTPPEPEPAEPEPFEPDQVVPETTDGPEAPPSQAPPDTSILIEPGVDFVQRGDALVAVPRDGADDLWRLDFLSGSGLNSTSALFHEGTVYLGHGYSLLEIAPLTGQVLVRHRLPAQVTRLETGDEGVLGWIELPETSNEGVGVEPTGRTFLLENGAPRWRDDGLEERSPLAANPFPADVELFGWLRQEAEVVDPLARLVQDPTNPFLHLRAGETVSNDGARHSAFEDALERAETFFEYAQLAQGLFDAGAPELAERAMDAGLSDFAARGYDPRLLTDLELHAAYGFPLPRFERALARGGLAEARFWAPWVYALAAETVPESEEALREFSRQLRSVGDRDAANEWRTRSNLPGRGGLLTVLDRLFEALGRVGWYAVASLLIAILALHLTLIAKYWRPQAVLGAERRGGRAPAPAAHLLAIRYYSFVEKIVLVLMFAAAIALAGLAIWQASTLEGDSSWQRGNLSDLPPSIASAGRIQDTANPLGRFVTGVIAQTQGDEERAIVAYREAGDFAPALNNLAALTGNDTLLERALEIDPRLVEARFNAGLIDDPSPFHSAYRSEVPLLATPTPGDLRDLAVGGWREALGRTFSDPWNTFRDARAPGLERAWLWWTALTLFALAAVITLLWLAVPRPRLARNAPRTIAYQILALLLPGSGQADELWGLLLLTPWSIFGLDALANYFGWGIGLGLGLGVDLVVLTALYIVNTAAFIVELSSYNRRMRELKRKDPETALRFGMRVRETPKT